MTSRNGVAVIIKATTYNHDGNDRTTYYGPFLPHAGSAATSFVSTLERELGESGRYERWETSIEDVFIAEGESDCTVQAMR